MCVYVWLFYQGYLASITAIDVEGVTLDGKDFWVDNFNVSVGNSTAEDAAWITCKENGTTAEVRKTTLNKLRF